MGEDATPRGRDRSLLMVVAVGALVRLVYLATKWGDPLLLNDSIYYSGQARQLAEGTWFRELFVDRPGAEHGPLTSTLMAPLSWMDDPVPWQRTVTVLTGVALVWVLGHVAGELAGRRVGLTAAGIAALYPNLWMNDGLVMSESISILLVALALWAAWRLGSAAVDGAWRRATALLGLALGLGMLARSELVLLAPLLAAWVAVSRRVPRVHHEPGGRTRPDWRVALVALAVAAAVVSPWVVFNLTRFERPVFLTTNDGTTLLGANCDDAYHGAGVGGWSLICVASDPDYAMDEEPSVRSARQRSLAVHYVRSHLGEVPRVVAARIARTMDLYGWSDLVFQDVGEERPRWAAWAGIGMFWVLAAAAVAGVRRCSRRVRWLLAAPVAVTVATTVLFYGGHRIRSTAEPVVVILAAVSVAALWPRRSGAAAGPTR